jgi:hypothetical protein
MKLQDQVITVEQAKRLEQLGITCESPAYHWIYDSSMKWVLHPLGYYYLENEGIEYFPAYTVAELGMMLPTAHDSMRLHEGWRVYNEDGHDGTGKDEVFRTEAEARGALLIYLLENNIITPEQCNAALA